MRSAWTVMVLILTSACLGEAAASDDHCPAPRQVAPAPEPSDGDHVAPAAPRVDGVYVSRWRLHVDATFAPDTAYVQIEIEDGTSPRIVLWTTPDALELCPDRPLDVAAPRGTARAVIRAVDLAGNTSETVVDAVVPSHRRFRCGTGNFLVLAVLIPPVVLGLGIALLVIVWLRRRPLKEPGTDVAPLVAEALVRDILNRELIAVGLGIVLVLVLKTIEYYGSASLVAVVSLTSFTRVLAANRMLRVLVAGESAALHGTLLAAGDRTLATSKRAIARAHQRAMPMSIVHPRTHRP